MKDFVPRPWQEPMLAHLFEHERCALWAGMGMGKTSVTEIFLDALYLAGESHPTLILGPKRVARSTWTNETQKWNQLKGLSIVPIIGDQQARLAALKHDAPIFTTNYENIEWLIEQWGDRWPYRTVIADEATRVKGHRISFREGKQRKDGTRGEEFLAGQGTKRAGALARLAHTHIKRFIELTGTPAPNGLKDLWAQLWFLDRGVRLGRTFDAFMKRWFSKGYDGFTVEPNKFADEQIHAAVRDLCLTIDPKDWLDLEEPIINNVYVDLPVKARKLYKDMEKEMFLEIEGRSAEAFNAAARTQKCSQLASGAVYVDPLCDSEDSPRSKEWKLVHDEKIEALESIVAETGGANLLVAYEFKSDLARLLKAFPKGRALRGQKEEDDFRDGKIPMLFMHPKSAGHGIDGWQNHCNNIVFFSQSWNLEEYQQAVERVGPVRQMQANTGKPVFIHHILARDTVDELVMERRQTKRATQDILLEACKRRKGK